MNQYLLWKIAFLWSHVLNHIAFLVHKVAFNTQFKLQKKIPDNQRYDLKIVQGKKPKRPHKSKTVISQTYSLLASKLLYVPGSPVVEQASLQ